MKYYIAREINDNPKLIFDLIAKSDDEYNELGLATEPNVFNENELPDYTYNICNKQLDGSGGLEDRSQAEIDAAESAHNTLLAEEDIAKKFEELEALAKTIDTMTKMGIDTTDEQAAFAILKAEYEALVGG